MDSPVGIYVLKPIRTIYTKAQQSSHRSSYWICLTWNSQTHRWQNLWQHYCI